MISLISIVKNEAPNIDRFLDSALAVCDQAVVVDTGSEDGTIARLVARGVMPYIHEFNGFGPSRTVAFEQARGTADWLLCLDADMTVDIDPDFEPDPEVDAYLVEVGSADFSYRLPLLLNGKCQWKSVGRVHEYTAMADGSLGVRVSTDAVRVTNHGAGRSSPEKSRWQLDLLWQDKADDPANPRTIFYLAQTYAELGNAAEAINWYDARVAMGGFPEEVYVAALRAARLAEWPESRDRFWKAWMLRPARAEAPAGLARVLNEHDDHSTAYAVASVPCSASDDILFVEPGAWRWALDFERSIAAWWVGRKEESYELGRSLLARDLPDHIRAQVERNLAL